MIHEIVKQTLKQIEQYNVEREVEKFEMVYCMGRIEASLGYREAMVTLNSHLDKHYTLKGLKPPMEILYYPHENGGDMLRQ